MATNWNEGLIDYCERLGPNFWAEPLNAISNAGFLVACFLLLRRAGLQARTDGAVPATIRLQALMIGVIGIGSFLFHTFATRWAALADIVPIQLFILGYAANFVRWMAGVRWRWAWLAMPIFFVFAKFVGELFVPILPFGSAGYAPALLALIAFAVYLALQRRTAWRGYAAAAVVFAISLTLRTVDRPLCSSIPTGTHFVWHLLNAVTLYLATAQLLVHWRERAVATRGSADARPQNA